MLPRRGARKSAPPNIDEPQKLTTMPADEDDQAADAGEEAGPDRPQESPFWALGGDVTTGSAASRA